MIIIAGTVDIDPAQRAAALAAGRQLEAETRRQPGCLDYVWTVDGLSPSTIYVYERWESEEALAAHFKGPYYRGMRETIGAHGIRGAKVAKYQIAVSEPVYDASGTPRADFFTAPGA
jgi:quinol monooxygenase YgiN